MAVLQLRLSGWGSSVAQGSHFTMAGMLYRTPFPTLGQYFTVVSKAIKTEAVI